MTTKLYGSEIDDRENKISDTKPIVNSKILQAEEYLQRKYDFRFDIVKQKVEFREANTTKMFKPLEKYTLLSMKRELIQAGISISSGALSEALTCSFSPKVDPIKEYFEALPAWDGVTDHIAELSNTVKVKNNANWYNYFKKWLIAVVANAFHDHKCDNHTMLVLTGDQGKFKTTWLENLCPKSLKKYLYTGKLNLESKDVLTYIAEFLFVNIDDQLKQLNKKDENELKNLITINHVKYRKPYDPFITEHPHKCSFMASINGNEFLNDPTGSRRFLPFEVEAININAAQSMDLDKAWSQAFTLFKTGERHWFNDEEIQVLYENNRAFSMISIEEELLLHYYMQDEIPGHLLRPEYLTTSIILSKLQMHTKSILTPKRLGEALKKHNFERKSINTDSGSRYAWKVVEKSQDLIKEETIF